MLRKKLNNGSEADEKLSEVAVSEPSLSCGVRDMVDADESVDRGREVQDERESHAEVKSAHGDDDDDDDDDGGGDDDDDDDDSHDDDDGGDDDGDDATSSDVFVESRLSVISGDSPALCGHERVADSESNNQSPRQSPLCKEAELHDQQSATGVGRMIDECSNAASDSGHGSPRTATADDDASAEKPAGILLSNSFLCTVYLG